MGLGLVGLPQRPQPFLGVVARDGVAERALFVIDPGGVIRWSYVSPVGVNPGADGVLKALEALTAKEKAS